MGFSVSKEFPSRFLKGDEIVGREVPVVIKEIRKENVYSRQTNKNDQVLVVYFMGKERGVILKKERANDIKQIIGSDDTDNWLGRTVRMVTEKRKAGTGIYDVIRFKEPAPDELTPEEKKVLASQIK